MFLHSVSDVTWRNLVTDSQIRSALEICTRHAPCKLIVQVVLLPLSSPTTLVAAAMFESWMRCRLLVQRNQPLSGAQASPHHFDFVTFYIRPLLSSTIYTSLFELYKIVSYPRLGITQQKMETVLFDTGSILTEKNS